MKVGFFTVADPDPAWHEHQYGLAEKLIASVRSAQPGVPVVQLTNEESPSVPGVDETLRIPSRPIFDPDPYDENGRRRKADGRLFEFRFQVFAECHGDWLLVDTDVVIRRDVSDIFDGDFDIAIADRNWPHLPQDFKTMTTIPYNAGVVFSKNPEFWQAALDEMRAKGEYEWISDQRAMWRTIRSGRFRVKILEGMVYNYPPVDEDDPCTGAAIVHYKGGRKKRRVS